MEKSGIDSSLSSSAQCHQLSCSCIGVEGWVEGDSLFLSDLFISFIIYFFSFPIYISFVLS